MRLTPSMTTQPAFIACWLCCFIGCKPLRKKNQLYPKPSYLRHSRQTSSLCQAHVKAACGARHRAQQEWQWPDACSPALLPVANAVPQCPCNLLCLVFIAVSCQWTSMVYVLSHRVFQRGLNGLFIVTSSRCQCSLQRQPAGAAARQAVPPE